MSINQINNLVQLGSLVEAMNYTILNPKHEVPATRIEMTKFPVEIRALIIEHYLQGEVDDGNIRKAIHYDTFHKPCCVWNWPEELVICDKAAKNELPDMNFPKWLPNLAVASHRMHGEVVVHMLKTTSCFVLKYDPQMPIKIAPWFGDFLATFPGATGAEGLEAVKDVSFPHVHWYDHGRDGTANGTNPEVDLMLKCPKLERIGLTFHTLRVHRENNQGVRHPITLESMLDTFKLEPMLGCSSLKHVYLGGIKQHTLHVEGGQLKTLRDFGNWLKTSFEKDKNKDVTVALHERTGVFVSWGTGELL